MLKLTWVLAVLLPWTLCEAHKVLVFFPMTSKSHSILGEGVVNRLLDAGNEVTYVTPYPMKISNKNLRIVELVGLEEELEKDMGNFMNLENILDKKTPMINEDAMIFMTVHINSLTIKNENLQKLLNDPNEKFDLVFIEWMGTEIAAGLSAVFNCPYVWLATTDPHYLVLHLVDEYTNPAYTVGFISENIAPLNFWQRIMELKSQILSYIKKEYVYYHHESNAYESLFGPIVAKKGIPLPPLSEIKYNASLLFGNAHVSMGESMRLPQAFKPIGGYHIYTDVKPLPENLKKIMDNAKHGVIYFSMGSNLKSRELPESIKRGLLKMFSGLKQTVLWKFEEELSDLPSNVHILKWAPQHSILAHPNCVLFITHGGLLSTTEAIHFGKPLVGIPVFGDQFTNVQRAVKKGFSEKVDFTYSLVEDLKVAVDKVLNNPRYQQRAKELSFIYHNRPASPGHELAHWVDHVVRTGGAPHLRSPALHMPIYQKLYLDFAALVLLILFAIRFFIKRLFFSKKKASSKTKKNQ